MCSNFGGKWDIPSFKVRDGGAGYRLNAETDRQKEAMLLEDIKWIHCLAQGDQKLDTWFIW